ncbi:MAG: hypothetical protein O3B00_05085, partial [archaeon]|nr:hypothetical protein [archaeon]
LNGMKIHRVRTINQSIRMRWKGLSETPSNKKKPLEGLAVGLFVRYRYEGPIANPSERIIHAQGSYVEALVDICYSFIRFTNSV